MLLGLCERVGSAVGLRLMKSSPRSLPRRFRYRVGGLDLAIVLGLRTEVTSFCELFVDGFFQMVLFVGGLAFKVFTNVVAMTARSGNSNLWCRSSGML